VAPNPHAIPPTDFPRAGCTPVSDDLPTPRSISRTASRVHIWCKSLSPPSNSASDRRGSFCGWAQIRRCPKEPGRDGKACPSRCARRPDPRPAAPMRRPTGRQSRATVTAVPFHLHQRHTSPLPASTSAARSVSFAWRHGLVMCVAGFSSAVRADLKRGSTHWTGGAVIPVVATSWYS
jgi:hypothetical protein